MTELINEKTKELTAYTAEYIRKLSNIPCISTSAVAIEH